MPILNEELSFLHVHPGEPAKSAAIHATFVGKAARRTLLPAGTDLYKFTGYGVMPTRPGGAMSPWWASVRPLAGHPDPGLDGHIAAAEAAGQTVLEYAREAFAVMLNWNTLGQPATGLAKVERIRLRESVYGFAGACQRMRESLSPEKDGSANKRYQRKLTAGGKEIVMHAWKSPTHSPPTFTGGAIQIYIPNLTTAHIDAVGMHLV
jgi:hypothetical protein